MPGKEKESDLKTVAQQVFFKEDLWLKLPELNGCVYSLDDFPVFSKVEVVSGKYEPHSSLQTFYHLILRIKNNDTEGQLKFVGSLDSLEQSYESILRSTKENCFYSFNPKKKYRNSISDWSLIAKSRFRIGFSQTQVQLALGEPDNIHKTVRTGFVYEQWVYEKGSFRGYIYFENGRLKSWQD